MLWTNKAREKLSGGIYFHWSHIGHWSRELCELNKPRNVYIPFVIVVILNIEENVIRFIDKNWSRNRIDEREEEISIWNWQCQESTIVLRLGWIFISTGSGQLSWIPEIFKLNRASQETIVLIDWAVNFYKLSVKNVCGIHGNRDGQCETETDPEWSFELATQKH